ncbi:unnamed protein product [Ilex paraguariensis]|uniref:Uncharacterized protein n=1 Tax=Ilex paraguariensis TaxID=185542 RepID=A0ABC8U0I6_9AQUA
MSWLLITEKMLVSCIQMCDKNFMISRLSVCKLTSSPMLGLVGILLSQQPCLELCYKNKVSLSSFHFKSSPYLILRYTPATATVFFYAFFFSRSNFVCFLHYHYQCMKVVTWKYLSSVMVPLGTAVRMVKAVSTCKVLFENDIV